MSNSNMLDYTRTLYPEIEPYETGMLDVGEGHQLYYERVGTPSRANTANGPVSTYEVTLKRVRIGAIELRDVAGTVVDGDSPTRVLLGNSFLNRLDMSRDGSVLELRQSQ